MFLNLKQFKHQSIISSKTKAKLSYAWVIEYNRIVITAAKKNKATFQTPIVKFMTRRNHNGNRDSNRI